MIRDGLILLAASLLAPSLLPVRAARAAETDNFHGRDGKLADSLRTMDEFVNSRLDEALKIANEKGCRTDGIQKAVSQVLGGMPFGAAENFADEDKRVAKVVVPNKQNIYGKDRFVFTGLAVPSCSPMIRLAGVYMGTDKLGHFFSEGFDYYIRGKGSMLDALKYGMRTENGNFGSQTTGVKSYADLAANYQGMLFFQDVSEGQNPYFVCQGGRYARTARRFSWKEYANDSWDEAINCSKLDPEMQEIVSGNMKSQNLRCPVDEAACARIGRMRDARYYVNPECLRLAKEAPLRPAPTDQGQPASCPGGPQPCEFREVRKQIRDIAAPLSAVPATSNSKGR